MTPSAPSIAVSPLFDVQRIGPPFPLDLSHTSPLLAGIDPTDQDALSARIRETMEDSPWAAGGYLEDRRTLLAHLPQMHLERRFFHLGIDIVAPSRSALLAPLPAVVALSGVEEGEGNYGGYVLLSHMRSGQTTLSFYGHLNPHALPAQGEQFDAGEAFAQLGDPEGNGGWFVHTHVQMLTEQGFSAGYLSKGYCRAEDLPTIGRFCPSPALFLGLEA